MLKAFKEGARPFGIYACSLAMAGAAFAPWVTAEKMILVASLVGALAGLRSYDKKIGALAE